MNNIYEDFFGCDGYSIIDYDILNEKKYIIDKTINDYIKKIEESNEKYIKENIKPFNNKELNVIRLVENRTIATFENRNVIEEIIDFVKENVLANNKTIKTIKEPIELPLKNGEYINDICLKYFIEIPTDILKQFNIDNNLKIRIICTRIKLNEEVDYKQMQFLSRYFPIDKTNSRKHQNEIQLSCWMNGKNLIDNVLRRNLVHELNHAIEDNKRIPKGYGLIDRIDKKNLDFAQKLMHSSEIQYKYLGNILYRLWDNSEIPAGATSVYSDLKSKNSDRVNFRQDLQQTQAYREYKMLIDKAYPLVAQINNDDIWMWIQYNLTKNISIDSKEYKAFFLRKTKKLLDDYFVKIGKSASLWYDEKENNL